MNSICIPIIVIICYLIGEVYKIVFQKQKTLYKLLPIIMSILGGILGLVIYKTNKSIIFDVSNIWDAIYIGIASGASATGTNQIIKQIFKEEEKDETIYR